MSEPLNEPEESPLFDLKPIPALQKGISVLPFREKERSLQDDGTEVVTYHTIALKIGSYDETSDDYRNNSYPGQPILVVPRDEVRELIDKLEEAFAEIDDVTT